MQISGAWRLTARVFLPFAAGYYLSYLFRTINALIPGHLSSDIGLGTADLGFLGQAISFRGGPDPLLAVPMAP